MTILTAIASYEGFYKTGSRAQRNNNPGNINYEPFMAYEGAELETIPEGVNERARFAHFATVDSGWSMLRHLLVTRYIGMTIVAAINKYAPSTENNSNAYAECVAHETGLSLETELTVENIG